MKKDWFRGIEDKEEFKDLLRISKPVLDKLGDLCYNKLEALESSKRKKPDYQDSSWPFVQADQNGYERAMHEIIEMIKSIEE